MNIDAEGPFSKLAEQADRLLRKVRSTDAAIGLGNATLRIGREQNPQYKVDADALLSPAYVGDARWIGNQKVGMTSEIDRLLGLKSDKVGMAYRWNHNTSKYDIHWGKTKGY